ncbi:thiamine-phosphate kinase [Leucobacter sp. CSA1]|uniref:Thiamine-monophosphate kinase n=1 Tax=Leucobacter chromiisoli TaxID=2796471 RepID=A0A934Q8R3_9MICO|nr:thiamine-phosphate kinase [Leucobacter chromiisoli]
MLRRILTRLGPADAAVLGPGDDCAVLRTSGDLVVTTDTMIEGPDFRLAWHRGFELGWKLAATNLSDVASMGARPVALTLALACPRRTPVGLLEEIASGLDAACRSLAPGCGVVGGDLGTAPVLTGAVTALGDLEGRPPATRSGASPGDVVAYAGDLGLAGLGLSLLFRDGTEPDGTAHDRALARLREEHPAALTAQLAPSPPIALGAEAVRGGATAMMDVSDSLSLDAARLARASGARVSLDSQRLLAGFGLQRGERVPLEAMLTGGEDHGLLATFPRGARLPGGFREIGEVLEASGPEPAARSGKRDDVRVDGERYAPRGWDPYSLPLPGA